MPTTHQQIEAWKARLLDLGRRNRLLHTQPGRAGTVTLTDPPVAALFDALARSRRKLTFAAALTLEQRLAALSWEAPATGVTMRLDRIPTPPPKAGQLATDLSPVDQDRMLYNLRLKARTALNEQGVNILFVALGFLEWFAPDTPEQIWRSPLLLLPVELQRAPLGAEYLLRPLDDEIALNPTLAHKLHQDFGLALPELPEEIDELQLEQLFAEISTLVMARTGWRVVPEATLGLFSFLKLLMYHDLDRAAAAAEAHPILAMLAGSAELKIENAELKNASTETSQFSIFNSQFSLDSRSPADCFQVLDADSSQAAAIAAALDGQSFVLQGPPGTGKSQTIANIIAECLAAGKRVLFVSEKMAALQVVFERLKQCGLADFCLEAHSHKASKRAVLDALGVALNAAPPAAASAFAYAELAATRAQLNDYAVALHAPHGPQRWTPYQMYARLAGLADAPDSAALLGELDSYTPDRLGAIDALLARIDTRRQLLQSLPGNVWRGCAITTGSFELRGQIRTRLRALLAALSETHAATASFAAALELPASNDLAGARALHGLAALLHEPYLLPAEWLAAGHDPSRRGIIDAARQDYAALAAAEARLLQRHRATLLDLDLDGMLARFTQHYRGWTRVLRPQFHRDLAAMRASLQPGAALDPAAALADLQLAAAVRATRAREHAQLAGLVAQLGSPFAGRATDWDALAARADWADRWFALALPTPLSEHVTQLLTTDSPARAAFIAGSGGAPVERLQTALTRLDDELTFFLELRIENVKLRKEPLERAQFSILNSQFSMLLERMADLDSWWEFCELRRAADALGIAAYLDRLSYDSDAAAQPRQAFHKRLCTLWLDAAYDRNPALRQFQRAPHAALVERFRQLDCGQLVATQARLHQRLAARRPLPEQAAVPGSELAILRRELQKQRRHKPIRQLFREIPDLLGRIKPCLLMSPLSVSQFLDPDAARFDLVIFDEASQIRTEDAVGAVLRGAALIVVGDNKQLPPTSFFLADAEGEFVDEDQDALDSFESILDAASAGGLPARMLRWHYRSRDEALIAFSNARFYAGRLATFPNAAATAGQGVRFEHVADGVYDRQGSRANPIEARRVADIVCRQLKATPELSLGVVAFSQSQQLAILHELERRRAADPMLDPLFDEARAEPLFVKNLENVQGDERDIMIVSVGYGRDAGGRLLMNFGPLNQQGGERRLNVAITRARRQVTLVSSLLPEDIDLKRTTHPGPRLLREYLEYARRGGAENQEPRTENRAPESGSRFSVLGSTPRFEDQLAAALAQRGLSLARQIGHSDFRIDIAIRDPRDHGRFLLGIECDGDDYRDAATARDRERLREQVLGGLGWQIERVWSADWARDPAAEVERVLAAVERLEAAAPATALPKPPTDDET
jgi:very-short-patch-repair endonuclease